MVFNRMSNKAIALGVFGLSLAAVLSANQAEARSEPVVPLPPATKCYSVDDIEHFQNKVANRMTNGHKHGSLSDRESIELQRLFDEYLDLKNKMLDSGNCLDRSEVAQLKAKLSKLNQKVDRFLKNSERRPAVDRVSPPFGGGGGPLPPLPPGAVY